MKKLILLSLAFLVTLLFIANWKYSIFNKIFNSTKFIDNIEIIPLDNNCRFFYYSTKEQHIVIGLSNKDNTAIVQFEFNEGKLLKTSIYKNNESKIFEGENFLIPTTISSSPFPTEIQKSNLSGEIDFLEKEIFLCIDNLWILLDSSNEGLQLNIAYNTGEINRNDFMSASDSSYHVFWNNGTIKKMNYYVKSTDSFRCVFYDQNGDGIIDYVTTLEKENDGTHKIIKIEKRDEFMSKH